MSAEQYGASLLAEVHEESLKEILFDLRRTVNPFPTTILRIPPLDNIIEGIRYPSDDGTSSISFVGTGTETGRDQDQSYHSRDDYHSGTTSPNRSIATVKLKPIILNISLSPLRDQGETHLLYYFAAMSVLPLAQGGKDGTVVWLDTCQRFSSLSLYQVITAHLRRRAPNLSAPLTSTIAKDCLKHVHLLNIPSSNKLISTLDELHSYLYQSSEDRSFQHHSSHRHLALLVLDSATQFYWQDRFNAEVARLQPATTPNLVSEPSRLPKDTPARQSEKPSVTSAMQVLDKLKSVQSRFDCAVVYSSNSTSTFASVANKARGNSANSSTLHSEVPSEEHLTTDIFTSSALLTLHMSRLEVPQFASQMSLDACLKDRSKRQEVVDKGAVKVMVTVGVGAQRTGGSRGRKQHEFVMKATERDGVVIEET